MCHVLEKGNTKLSCVRVSAHCLKQTLHSSCLSVATLPPAQTEPTVFVSLLLLKLLLLWILGLGARAVYSAGTGWGSGGLLLGKMSTS